MENFIGEQRADPLLRKVWQQYDVWQQDRPEIVNGVDIVIGHNNFQEWVVKEDGRMYQKIIGGRLGKENILGIERLYIPKRFRRETMETDQCTRQCSGQICIETWNYFVEVVILVRGITHCQQIQKDTHRHMVGSSSKLSRAQEVHCFYR
jgi:hypothetical protein